ncbi:hypothetical protein KM043_002869 [Ampulex compressa]|nr:hypothetical protein KM043_002869 [Ampulex compressa]
MVLPSDIRAVLYAARFFGCGFHIVTEDDVLVTKRGTMYTIFWIIIFLSCCAVGMHILMSESHIDVRLMILTVTRTIFSYVCLFTDIILAIRWNWKLRAVLSQLKTFDRAMRFNESRIRRRTRMISRLMVCVTITFWTVVGYVTYYYEPTASLFNALTYGIINSAISIQILVFVALSFLLCERFRYLCETLLLPQASGKIMVVDRAHRHFGLQEVWWLHCCLANAMETMNSVYTMQLLFWIASMSFNTLSRIYTIVENGKVSTLLKVRETLLATSCAVNLLLITAICHMTASQANRVGKIIFSPLSAVIGKRNFAQDNVEAAAYFQLRKVHFSAAAGLIRVDLPLLLSIASGITTYLVILHAASNV